MFSESDYVTSEGLVCDYRFLITKKETDVYVLEDCWHHARAQYYRMRTHQLDFLK